MEQFSTIKAQLNEALRNKLEAAQCISGHLEYRVSPSLLLTLRGQKADGKPFFFWEADRQLNKLLDRYLATEATHAVAFTISINLEHNHFAYNIISPEQAAAQKDKEARDHEEEETAACRSSNKCYWPGILHMGANWRKR